MKICHVTSAHKSDDVRLLEKQCVSLAKNPNNEVYLVAKGKSYKHKNVSIVGVGELTGGRLSRLFNHSKRVIDIATEIDADIYEFHDPELLLYARKFKRKGKKVIFDSHENYSLQIESKLYIPRIFRKLVKNIYLIIETYASNYLDAALFPTDDNPFKGKVAKCVTIRNSPIINEFENSVPYERRPNAVCCVGSLTEARGIKVLIEACYKANVKLILGGTFTPSSFADEVMSMKEFSIVDYRGYCSREDVVDIYSNSCIGTDTILKVGHYAKTNAISTKVYEYMASGIPFITSNFPNNIKFLELYGCGVHVEPSNSDEIAEKILYLIENKKIAGEMGAKGKAASLNFFSWAKDEERLIDLYEELH